jgi:hypothetical protein
VISDAALGRLEKACMGPEEVETIQVRSNDVFAATREIRALRRKADQGEKLRDALRVIGDALHDEPMVGDV